MEPRGACFDSLPDDIVHHLFQFVGKPIHGLSLKIHKLCTEWEINWLQRNISNFRAKSRSLYVYDPRRDNITSYERSKGYDGVITNFTELNHLKCTEQINIVIRFGFHILDHSLEQMLKHFARSSALIRIIGTSATIAHLQMPAALEIQSRVSFHNLYLSLGASFAWKQGYRDVDTGLEVGNTPKLIWLLIALNRGIIKVTFRGTFEAENCRFWNHCSRAAVGQDGIAIISSFGASTVAVKGSTFDDMWSCIQFIEEDDCTLVCKCPICKCAHCASMIFIVCYTVER